MYHHDSRSYNVAASAAAKAGREKMEKVIHDGITSAERVIEQVQGQVPHDRIVKGSAIDFATGKDGFALVLPDAIKGQFTTSRLHEHALRQVAEKSGVPSRFVDDLAAKGDWGRDLVAHNFRTILREQDQRFLVREVGGETRGFLSDRFRRLDSRPLLDAFVGAANANGLVPIQGHALDTKVRLRAVLPEVFEPLPNEVMVFGLEWGNSDFGNGGHQVSLWVMRIWCTNLAIGEEVLRQVHLGKRLEDNIEYSQRTYRLDTSANASALKDAVSHAISPNRVHGYLEAVKQAADKEMTIKDASAAVKKALTKAEAEKVIDAFDSPDVVNLPAGSTVYRLSNAVSWIAQAKGISQARQLDLQKFAGDLLPRIGNGHRAVEV